MFKSVSDLARRVGIVGWLLLVVVLLLAAVLLNRILQDGWTTAQQEATPIICVYPLYYVQPGDTLSSIALQSGVTLKDLRERNKFPPGEDRIFTGQVLEIPLCSNVPRTTVIAPVSTPEGQPYMVDAGDTCASIAGLFNISEASLIAANQLPADCSTLWVGQMLRVPLPTGVPTPASTREERGKLTLEEAEAQVHEYVFATQPGMNPAARFPLVEKTGAETWQRMGLQIYQVTEGVQQFQSYVIAVGKVYPIGESFGGMGVHTQLVTDLDQDGAPELVYAYSYGSGISRSEVGILYPVEDGYASMPAADFHYQGDLTLERLDDATVRVNPRGAGEPLGMLRLVGGLLVVAPLN